MMTNHSVKYINLIDLPVNEFGDGGCDDLIFCLWLFSEPDGGPLYIIKGVAGRRNGRWWLEW